MSRILDIVKRGPLYVLKKCIIFMDKPYRRKRKQIFIKKYIKTQVVPPAATQSFAAPRIKEQILTIAAKTPREEFLQMADRYANDEMLLFGQWIKIVGDAWNSDFVSGKQYNQDLYTCIPIDFNDGEIKVPWELGRMHSLPVLATAWLYTGNHTYLSKVQAILDDFMECTVYGYGVQWWCPMEVAIRVFNILMCYCLLYDTLDAEDPMHDIIVKQAWEHGQYLIHNLETAAHLQSNNHYLADLLGLLSISCVIDFGSVSKRWFQFCMRELERESKRQIYPDGGNIEASIAYTRLDGEMLFYAALLTWSVNRTFSAVYYHRLAAISRFIRSCTLPDGTCPPIGDNDSGRIMIWRDRGIMELSYLADRIDQFLPLFTDNIMMVSLPSSESAQYCSVCHKNSGIAILRNAIFSCVLSCTDAFTEDAEGHMHNDKLSFVLYVHDKPFFIDPGTGYYTSNTSIRDQLRGTRSHNTFYEIGVEQNPLDRLFSYQYKAMNCSIRCSAFSVVASYFRKPVLYERTITMEQKSISICDMCSDPSRKCEWSYLLHPDVQVFKEKQGTYLLRNGQVTISFKCPLALSQESALYSERYHSVKQTIVLRGSTEDLDSPLVTVISTEET